MIKMSSNDGSSNGGDGATLKKGPWSAGEDAILIDYVRKHGEGNWNAVQRNTALQRCGKSCRLRWANHLRPNLKKGAFSFDEERLIIELHSKLGNKWARISSHLPGRTDNEIKNYWNTRVKRRLRSGLPLYPTNFPINRPPPPQQVVPPQQPPANLPMFDPVSFSSSPLFSFHQPPPFMFSQPIKNPNPFLGRPVSSPSQLGQIHPSLVGFGFDSDLTHIEGGGLGFSGLNFELPSNQVYQKVNINNDCKIFEEVKSNANLGRTNSGLLNDLLEEAREKVRVNGGALKERNDCGLLWDISSSNSSFPGIKKKESEEPQLMNSMVVEDLSSILELIPSLVQVPSWSDDGGGRESSSVGQSSVISGDDNNNNRLDQPPQFPSFGASSSTDYDVVDDGYWNPGSDAWDNLPKIC